MKWCKCRPVTVFRLHRDAYRNKIIQINVIGFRYQICAVIDFLIDGIVLYDAKALSHVRKLINCKYISLIAELEPHDRGYSAF